MRGQFPSSHQGVDLAIILQHDDVGERGKAVLQGCILFARAFGLPNGRKRSVRHETARTMLSQQGGERRDPPAAPVLHPCLGEWGAPFQTHDDR